MDLQQGTRWFWAINNTWQSLKKKKKRHLDEVFLHTASAGHDGIDLMRRD
jgi:hypothetical protein